MAMRALEIVGQSWFEILFVTSPSGIIVADLDGRIIDVNNSACRVLGYSQDELKGRDIKSISMLSAADIRCNIEQLTHGETAKRVVTNIRKDGTECVLELRETLVRLPDGTDAVLVVSNDITRRVSAENALRESDQKLRDLVENIPAFVLTIDLDGRILYVNQTQPGMSMEHVIGKSIFDFAEPDEYTKIRDAFDKIVTTGEPQSVELRAEGARGSIAWYSCRFGPIRKEGKIVGVAGFSQDITEQKQAEQAVNFNQKRYQDLVEEIDGIVWECKADTLEFTYISPRVEEMLGYPVQQWYDNPDLWPSVIHPDDRERSIEFCRQRTEEGIDHHFDYRANTADGRTIWIHDQVRLIRDEDGQVTLLRGIMIDITERKRDQAFRDGETVVLEKLAKGHEIAEVLNDLVLTLECAVPDMIGSILLLDESASVLRHGAAPSLPEEYNQLIDGIEIGPQVGSCGTAAYLNQQVVVEDTFTDPLWSDYRELAQRFDLRACWSHPVVSSDGRVLGTLAMYYRAPRRPSKEEQELIATAARLASVVIEHRRIIRAHRDSEAKFRHLFDHSPSAIFVEDINGTVLDANLAACELHGFPREKLVGQNVLDLVPSHSREQTGRDFSRIVEGDLIEFEGMSRHASGRSVPVSIRVSPIEYDGEHCLLFHVQDITKRKQAEDEFHKQQDQLAHVSRLTTMGQMVAGLAHELNQPLYAIANFATACSRTLESGNFETDEKLVDWNRKIADQANRAGEIIRRMRDFSRKDRMKHSDVDVNVLVKDSMELVAAEARRDRVDVRCEYLDPPIVLHVDVIQIQQTLVNLLQNAFQALETAERARKLVAVRILRMEWEEDGNFVQIEIEDNGIGLPEGSAESLYDAFYTTKPEGMGMGLAISRSIVDSQGGRLWATSNADHGTTFHFTLPLAGTTEKQRYV